MSRQAERVTCTPCVVARREITLTLPAAVYTYNRYVDVVLALDETQALELVKSLRAAVKQLHGAPA